MTHRAHHTFGSNFLNNHSRSSYQHELMGPRLYKQIVTTTIFTLRANKILIRTPKFMRKVAVALDLDLPTIAFHIYEK